MTILESDIVELAHRLSGAPTAVTLELLTAASDAGFAERLRGWACAFAEEAGLALSRGGSTSVESRLVVRNGTGTGFAYAAVPEGPEALPFCTGVACLAGIEDRPESPWAPQLDAVRNTVDLLVFVTPACPHCPNQVRQAMVLALASSKVDLTVVDAEAHLELAARHGARSVPFTVIGGDLGLVGAVPAAALVDHIVNLGGPGGDRAVLAAMIDNGRTEAAAVRLDDVRFRRAFAELWTHSVLSSRMGLMMLAEEALENRPHLMDDIVGELVPLLESDDVGLLGDTVDLLAAIAHPDAAGALKKLRDNPDEDIVEAAEEALEAISERQT